MAFISWRDMFVTLPTGYGKSLVFGRLPWISDEIKGKTIGVGTGGHVPPQNFMVPPRPRN